MRPATAPLVTYTRMEQDPRIAWIRLNRPEQRNAIDRQMAAHFRDAVTAFEDDALARVAILGGAGSVFCAGMDLGAFAAGEKPGIDDEFGFAGFVRRRRKKPIIAAVQGGAFAGGFEIMLACEFAIATTSARFALPEVKRGIIAAGGGAMRLPSRIPLVVAREMLLTGDPITVDRAYQLGLLNAVVALEDLDKTAEDLAARIAANAPLAVSASLALSDPAANAREEAGWEAIAAMWRLVEDSEDAREGATAFKEKRDPRWRGR